MKLEEMVCTLAQAKRLKELGVDTESYFYWDINNEGEYRIVSYKQGYKAYTSAELGEIIRAICYRGVFAQETRGDKGFIFLAADGNWPTQIRLRSYLIHEAHARTEFLIYLLENRNANL